jgi:hypothetical protein
MRRRSRRLALALAAVTALAVWITIGASAGTTHIPISGTGSPQTGEFTPSGAGDATDEELAGEEEDADEGPNPYGGTISFSTGAGGGRGVHKYDLAANRADPVDDRVCAPHGRT